MDKNILEIIKDAGLRKTKGLILVSTEKSLAEALKNGAKTAFFVYSGDKNKTAEKYGIPEKDCFAVKKSYIEKYSRIKSDRGFIALLFYRPKKTTGDKKIKTVLLDSIQDPSNLGAIIRSGVAFGFTEYFLFNCAYVFNEKVIRASAGAVFYAGISEIGAEDINGIKNERKLFITGGKDGEGPAALIKEEGFIIAFGNEGHGISKEIKKIADGKIKIGISSSVESLNVAAAAAIVFYAAEKTDGV